MQRCGLLRVESPVVVAASANAMLVDAEAWSSEGVGSGKVEVL